MMAQLEVVLSDTLPLPDTSTSSQPHLLWVSKLGPAVCLVPCSPGLSLKPNGLPAPRTARQAAGLPSEAGLPQLHAACAAAGLPFCGCH